MKPNVGPKPKAGVAADAVERDVDESDRTLSFVHGVYVLLLTVGQK